jgi:hypothetical protein
MSLPSHYPLVNQYNNILRGAQIIILQPPVALVFLGPNIHPQYPALKHSLPVKRGSNLHIHTEQQEKL